MPEPVSDVDRARITARLLAQRRNFARAMDGWYTAVLLDAIGSEQAHDAPTITGLENAAAAAWARLCAELGSARVLETQAFLSRKAA